MTARHAPSTPDAPHGSWPAVVLLAALSLMASCASVPGSAPWVDSRRDGGTDQRVGTSTLDYPAICFADSSQMAAVTALAKAECARTDRVAVWDRTDEWQCRIVTPQRAVYHCE